VVAGGQPVTIVQPYHGTTINFNGPLSITWSLTQPMNPILSTLQLTFTLEDERKGTSTGQPLSPSLGGAPVMSTNFTTASLSSLFTGANALTTGTNYTIRADLTGSYPPGTFSVIQFYSPQFTIQNGAAVSPSTSANAATSSGGVSSTATVTATAKSGAFAVDSTTVTGIMGAWTFLLAMFI